MKKSIKSLLQLPVPLPKEITDLRANCFNAVQLYFDEIDKPIFLGPEEFVLYLQSKFVQITLDLKTKTGDVSVVWSRSASLLAVGEIKIDKLQKEVVGYPFGLIIEHAFVFLDDGSVFQKRDPTSLGPYEIVSENIALKPYINAHGFEVTRHRRI